MGAAAIENESFCVTSTRSKLIEFIEILHAANIVAAFHLPATVRIVRRPYSYLFNATGVTYIGCYENSAELAKH